MFLAPQCTPNQTGLLSEWSRLKNALQKCDENKEDLYLAILSYRAIPLDHQLKSPAELLTNRKFKTILTLCQRALLNSTDHKAVKTKFITRQEKQAHYYHQNSEENRLYLYLIS